MQNPQKNSPTLLLCLALVFLTFVSFWGVWENDFVNYDDPDYVQDNEMVQRGLTAQGIAWAFKTNHASNWHPLTWLSHMIDRELFGPKAGGHHFTSLLLHAATVVVLFLLLLRATHAPWRSAIVAAFFAVHPLRVESVAWIAERKDVLSGLFWMLTLLAYVRYVEKPESRRYVITLGCFTLGLLSKPMLVTLPFVLLLLDFWPLRRIKLFATETNTGPGSSGGKPAKQNRPLPTTQTRSFSQLFQEKIPFFALTIIACVVTIWAQRSGGSVRSLTEFPFGVRLENAFVSCLRYLGKMVWPDNLAVFYPHPESWPGWLVGAAVLCVAGLTILSFKWLQRAPYVSVGWFWFLGTLVPVIGIVQVGIQSMADRYTYIPMIGLYVALVWGACELLTRWPGSKMLLQAAAVVGIGGCIVLTQQYLGRWKNSETLFRHALNVTDANYTAHENLGIVLAAQSKQAKAENNEVDANAKLAEAKEHFEAGLKIYPQIADSHHNLGNALVGMEQYDDAYKCYIEAIKLNPNYVSAYMNLGIISVRTGNMEQAKNYYSKVVELKPTDLVGHYNLATAFFELGNFDGAIRHYGKALELNPSHVPSLFQLGVVASAQGRRDDAVRQFNQVLQLEPDHGGAREQLTRINPFAQ